MENPAGKSNQPWRTKDANRTYIPKIRLEQKSTTVEFFLRKLSMPKISSTDALIHDALDLICDL